MLKKTTVILIIVFMLLGMFNVCFATKTDDSSNTVKTSEKEYQIVIEDDAELLTDGEEKELRGEMSKLSEYGNVLFLTTNEKIKGKSLKYIQDYYYLKFKNEAGVAFYIDMSNRQICACATGGLDKIITSSKCNTITDNIYRYASKEKYYECASKAFEQMHTLLIGGKIQENMKYICNAFLAVMISVFATYTLYNMITGNKKASNNDLIRECEVDLQHSAISVVKSGTHRVYSPQSSGSSGGGHGGGGGRRRIFW